MPSDIDLFEKAKLIAAMFHEGQKYGDEPYTAHLVDVDRVLLKFGHTDPVIRAAGRLHDVIEDTSLDAETLAALLTDYPEAAEVVAIVRAVTSKPGKNRRERNKATYPGIRALDKAVIVKLADRIANTARSFLNASSTFDMYKKEHAGFREALYREGELDAMWSYLEMLSSF